MGRKTKEQVREEKNEKRLNELVKTNKFLAYPKYYKNNYWSHAAWDSWASQGKAGSCGCGCGYYNRALANIRASTKSCNYVIEKLCDDCANKIEAKIGVKFKSKY